MQNDATQSDDAETENLRAFREKVRTLSVEELEALAALLRRGGDKMTAELRAVSEQISLRRGG
jgi:hypothetical protein